VHTRCPAGNPRSGSSSVITRYWPGGSGPRPRTRSRVTGR
jgi:hypothetical protein